MAIPPKTPEAARKSAQTYFTHTEQRDKAIKQEIEKERAASAAKTAKLRALRLAKEAAEKEAADKRKAEMPQASASRQRRKPIPS